MRTLAHFSAMLLALPQVLLATAFLLLGHVTGTKTLGGLLTRILDVFVAAFTWGGLAGLLVFAALALSAVFDRTRSFAAIAVALFVITSTIALLVTVPLEWADAWLFVPGAASLALCRYVAKTPVSSGEPNAPGQF
jgi:hypothetical protein